MHSTGLVLDKAVDQTSSRRTDPSDGWPSATGRVVWIFGKSPGLAVDLLCMSLSLFIMVIRPALLVNHAGLAAVLEMRISLHNLLLIAICVFFWGLILRDAASSTKEPSPGLKVAGSLAWQMLACTGVTGAILFLKHPGLAHAANLCVFMAVSTSLLLVSRLLVATYSARVKPAMRKDRRVLIVGAGWRGEKMHADLLSHPRWSYRNLGFIDIDPPNPLIPLLGSVDDLEDILMTTAVDEVIITLPIKSMYDQIQQTINVCEHAGVQVRYFTDVFATQVTKRRSVDEHQPSSVLLHLVHDQKGYLLKRGLDILVAGSGLVLLSPIMLVIALGIKLTSKGPVIFSQQRYGLNKHLFKMYKFRSMVVDAEQRQAALEHLNETGGATFKLARDPRITSIGHVLRKTSLDELPQLWNVVIGNMSLVGPRPLPMRDVSRFSEAWLMRRFSVAPGITGLWQVSGRSNITFQSWIELDLTYIDNWSFLLDLKILAKTLPAVLKGEGAV
ncbi:MAG: sugar transferase [Janthinobacterium lividum]